jgi:MerR family mercuric resistance operon transcriptional regulator
LSTRYPFGHRRATSLPFTRPSRELGFTLGEIRGLLALSGDDGKNTYSAAGQLAASHLADVRAKIADLRAMTSVLSDAVRRCDACELPGCPLIDALSAVSARRP